MIQFPISPEVYARLPRHPDWRYEMVSGVAHISRRPRPLQFRRSTSVPVVADRVRGVEIREVDLRRDDRGLVDLALEVWAVEDPYRSSEAPEAMVAGELERSLESLGLGAVAVEGGRVCAMALVDPERRSRAPCLTWLSVLPALRRRGVATALLAAVVDALASRGVTELASAASAANPASVRWHLSRGFELAGVTPSTNGPL